MNRFRITLATVALIGFFPAAGAVLFGSGGDEIDAPGKSTLTSSVGSSDKPEVARPSAAEARARAEMLHDLIHQLLLAVHENYYREDEGLLLPATTFGNVFEPFAERRNMEIHWLAVDAEPMNVDHRPHSEFEHAVVKALKSGQSVYDETSEGRYRYGGAIALTSRCLKCHVPNRTSTRDRIAAIVISMPVTQLSPP